MTRLKTDDIMNIPATIQGYDQVLKAKTGLSLKEIALEAAGDLRSDTQIDRLKVAIIPVTTGQGVIDGFAKAVQSIASHLGFSAFVTEFPDVRGLAEAYNKNSDLIMIADDHCFVAINLRSRLVIDNTKATAAGYVVALKQMSGSLNDKTVLLIGAGQMGSFAAEGLLQYGARLIIYDSSKEAEALLTHKLTDSYDENKVSFGYNFERALNMSSLIFDASSGGGFIPGEFIQDKSIVAAPGIPMGLSWCAFSKVHSTLVHDPLQIGVATMLFQALSE